MRIPAAILIATLGASPAQAQRPSLVGGFLPVRNLDRLQGAGAPRFGQLAGRAILIEFFAYW